MRSAILFAQIWALVSALPYPADSILSHTSTSLQSSSIEQPSSTEYASNTDTASQTVRNRTRTHVSSTRTPAPGTHSESSSTKSEASSPVRSLASLPKQDSTGGSNWWYPNVDHTSGAVRDYVPDLYTGSSPDYDYPVYFAVSGGDSSAFINALYASGPNGDRDNMWLAGEPRTVYVGPGTYVFSKTVYLDTDTVIIGDAVNPPVFQAAAGFSGDYLICGGQGSGASGGESHFSVMMKNVVLDTTPNSADSDFIALSWRVAQNSALVNVNISMPQGAHTGIWMGQGSTVQVGDVGFSYGNIGLHYDGSQQATLKNLYFSDCTYGIYIDSGFTINVFGATFNTVGNSIYLNSGSAWVSVIDSTSINSGTFFNSAVQYPNFMIENIHKDTTNSAMVVVDGNTKVSGSTTYVGTYVYGNTYGANPVYQTNPSVQSLSRPEALAPGGNYPRTVAPQYPDATIDDVINLKDSSQNGGYTLYGDGSSNDGPSLQGALNTAATQGKIAYLPFGIYRTEQTITIPSGTNLVGNGWSTISGYGSAFQDESNPTPIVQIGTSGETGTCQIQDMRFTVGEQLEGAIVLQINMAGSSPGDVAVHNSLITIGGTRDTQLSCTAEASCPGAYLGIHFAPGSSAYIDNFWTWLADHASDDSGLGIHVAGKGGVLVEATAGTWLAGFAAEHWWLYNLGFNDAENVLITLFQSETNYYQGSGASTPPPAPFTPTSADPSFDWCNGGSQQCPMTIAQYYQGGSNIYDYAAGSWNFFGGTQENMNVIDSEPNPLHLYGLTDHGTEYIMQLPNGDQFGDGSTDGYGGSWGTLVAEYSST